MQTAPAPAESLSRPGRHRAWWRRTLRLGALALGVLALLLLLDGVWAAFRVNQALRAARDDLTRGGDLLLHNGDVAAAAKAFGDAKASAEAATAALGHPGPRLAGLVPFLGANLEAARSVADAAAMAADAATELTQAADAAGWNGKSIPGFSSATSFDLAPIEAAIPGIVRAGQLLTRANATLASIDTKSLLGPVRSAVEQARSVVSQRASATERAASVVRLLPRLLGGNGDRRWLLVIMTPSDPRGGGGYPGQYAVLEADGNAIRLKDLGPTGTIPTVKPVDAPPEVVQRYRAFGATTSFIATTYSPNFPTDARLMQEIWQAAGRPPVDGVIAVDPVWMSYILEALGPVQTPSWPEAITADNVERIVGHDVYMTTSYDQSNRWQTAIGTALVRAIIEQPWPLQAMSAAMSKAASERHVMVYSIDPTEEGILHELGVDGAVRLTEEPPLVTFNGLVATRTGYFAQHTVETSAEVSPDGSSTVTVTITTKNSAPSEPPSLLVGDGRGYPAGTFAAEVSVYLPRNAKVLSSTVDGGPNETTIQQEFDHPVVVQAIVIPSGGTAVVQVVYTKPG